MLTQLMSGYTPQITLWISGIPYWDTLNTEGVVTDMHITGNKKPSQCIVCIRGKKVVRLSRTPDERATKPFEWIHTDISGPRNVESTTGDKNYLITFVCDYSNFITVYPVKSRSQIVEVLEDFLVFANQLGTVCKIRSDNAAEYLSKQFREVCTKNSILQQTSAPYCPSQNGTAERSFRTLGNKERCLLEESKLPEGFWPQAASYAAYLHNRTYCHRIRCTPFELVYGKRPNLAKLMRFGQNVEAYIHKGLRSNKVSPRTKPGRFVGICKLSSANLVYFQSENKVRPCAHTIAINDSTGTHGSGVRGHNASQDVYDEPHAAQDSAHGWLTPPRAVTPEVESPIYNTPGLIEPQGPPYTPLECEDDPPLMLSQCTCQVMTVYQEVVVVVR